MKLHYIVLCISINPFGNLLNAADRKHAAPEKKEQKCVSSVGEPKDYYAEANKVVKALDDLKLDIEPGVEPKKYLIGYMLASNSFQANSWLSGYHNIVLSAEGQAKTVLEKALTEARAVRLICIEDFMGELSNERNKLIPSESHTVSSSASQTNTQQSQIRHPRRRSGSSWCCC